jgi:hypothetical protein
MYASRKVTEDTYILPSEFPIPGFGKLPVNAYVIKAAQPVLVDTGLHLDADAFMQALESVIDPEDLRWLYLTHPDQDHLGSFKTIMERVPHIRLVTTFLGFGILSLTNQLPMDRLFFLNPGEQLDIGDRTITPMRPVTFDNPSTTAFVDSKTRALFSSDSFGALLPETAEDATDVSEDVLRGGQVAWTTVDSPWLHKVDRGLLASELNAIRQLDPSIVLSSHLPPAKGITDFMLDSIAAAPDSPSFVGPNQPALEAMLAEMTGAPA